MDAYARSSMPLTIGKRFYGIFFGLNLAALASLSTCVPIELDVHLPLRLTDSCMSVCPYSEALRSNLALRRASTGQDKAKGGTESVDFFRLHSPHVTLYLTRFDVADAVNGTVVPNATEVGALLSAISDAISSLIACRVSLNYSYSVSGPYAMWTVPVTSCLQHLSDTVVTAASPFMSRPPIVPDWVKSLPEPERSGRIRLVETYGSPNVMEWFIPHVTVGYENGATLEKRREVMNYLRETKPLVFGCAGTITRVRVGRTGAGGTVLQGGTVGDVTLDLPRSLGIRTA